MSPHGVPAHGERHRRRLGGLAPALGWLAIAGLAGSCAEDDALPSPSISPETGRACPAFLHPPRTDSARPWDIPSGVRPRQWRWIVIHHSGTPEGSAAAFDRYHREVKGWEDLAYHFVIGNGRGSPDGQIEPSARWLEQRPGAHAGDVEHNDRGIGICLVGDFERERPTQAQLASLRSLVRSLMDAFGIPPERILRHSDIVATKCPGRLMPWPLCE